MSYVYYKQGVKVDEPQEFKLLQVYDNHNDNLDKKIVDFWTEQNALPSYEDSYIAARLSDVLFIVLNSEDTIVGVCSGTVFNYEPIRDNFLYFRVFVHSDYRTNNNSIGSSMYFASFDLFNELKTFKSQNIVGLLIIYESDWLNKIIRYYNSAYYRNQFFLGWNDKNQQMRVTYFDNTSF